MKVLLVEDTNDLRDLFARLLRLNGCEVLAAECGYMALDLVADHSPELVLTDLMMPRMDGLELIRRLREIPDLVKVPIVLITADSSEAAARAARAAGAVDVVVKPVDVLRVLERYRRGELQVP